MNAHVSPDSAGGRPPLDTQVLAVQQSDLIRHLATVAATDIPAVAKALDRDPSNLRKTLARLEREGLVSLQPLTLTEAGRGWLPRLAALEGAPLGDGLPILTHGQIRLNPENPRQGFHGMEDEAIAADEDLNRLAENIARRGLKQGLLLRLDADSEGGEIVAGERRWRAIGLLIARGDPRWPAAKPVPYLPSDLEDAPEILADAIVENIQRQDLHPLDEAFGFRKLLDYGWSVGRILEETGIERKTFERRRDLLNLTPAQQARMRLPAEHEDHLSTKGARGLLQHLRQIQAATEEHEADEPPTADALGLTPKLKLALLEVAFAIEQKPSRDPVALTNRPEGGALATLAERDLVTLASSGGRWSVGIPKAGPAGAWLNEHGFYDNPAARVSAIRKEVVGHISEARLAQHRTFATPELNTDPLVVNGIRFPNMVHANEARRLANGGGTVNSGSRPAPKPAPEPTPQDLFAELKPREQLIMLELADKILRDPHLPHSFPVGVTRVGAYWLDGSLDRLVQELKLVQFANPAPGVGWLGMITSAGWSMLGAGTQEIPDVTMRLVRLNAGKPDWKGPGYVTPWLNLAAPAVAEAAPDAAAGAEEARDDLYDQAVALVVRDRKASTSHIQRHLQIGYNRAASLVERMEAEGVVGPADHAGKREVLAEPPTESAEHPPGEDEDAKAAEVLAKVLTGIQTGLFGQNGGQFDYVGFRELLELAGLSGPFRPGTGEEIGCVFDATNAEIAVVDVNAVLATDHADARAELLAFALNAVAGFSTRRAGQ